MAGAYQNENLLEIPWLPSAEAGEYGPLIGWDTCEGLLQLRVYWNGAWPESIQQVKVQSPRRAGKI